MQRGFGHADLLGVVCYLGLVDVAVLVPVVRSSPVRPVLVVPFLLLGPGYAVVAALFPERSLGTEGRWQEPLLRRVVLGFGASVAAVVAVGLTLDFSVFGFSRVPLLAGLNVVTVAAVLLAVRRRRAAGERAAAVSLSSVGEWVDVALGDSWLDAGLSGAMVVALLAAVVAVAGMPAAETATAEASLLTPGPDGPVADDYPQTLEAGEPTTLILGAESGTGSETAVTAVISLQEITVEDGRVAVLSETPVDTLSFTDPAGRTARQEHTVTPTVTGDRRLFYAVYFGDGEPTGAPDRTVYLQVTVVGEQA